MSEDKREALIYALFVVGITASAAGIFYVTAYW